MVRDDDRVEVHPLPLGKVATAVWISRSAEQALTAFAETNDGAKFAKKLKEIARGGFDKFQGGPIRWEGDGVYAIGIRLSLFRMLGFYGPAGPVEFIIIDADFKPGQGRGKKIDRKVEEVAKIRKFGHWRKVQP